ncbi:MAG: helix-turn-helix transcriptional regulator [Acidimicrobiaceae bacterium]|nr:helix-turn-helix transcriptional regulator [Acidimicrobiaceae bacterium]
MSEGFASGHLTAQQNARLRERLEALCEREGLSKRALATRAGLSAGAVQSIGATKAGPTLGTMLALTRALRLRSIDQLLGPTPTAFLTANDQIETQLSEGGMRVFMRIDN